MAPGRERRLIPSAISRLWDRLWYAPEPAVNLASARMIISGHALWVLLSRDFPGLAGLPEIFREGIAPVDRIRYLLLPGSEAAGEALWWVAALALASALIGLAPRSSCFVAGVALYHLAPLETIFWTPDPYERGLTISVLALLTLSASRCGDALTLPGWWRRRPARPVPGGASDAGSWEYGWPLRLVQLFIAQIYFFAGWSKLLRAGPGWAAPDNIRRWLLVPAQQDQLSILDGAGRWIADRPALCLAVGVVTLVVDLAFIAVPFSARLRRWLVPAAVVGHAGILAAMGIFFINLPQLLVFVSWPSRAARRARLP